MRSFHVKRYISGSSRSPCLCFLFDWQSQKLLIYKLCHPHIFNIGVCVTKSSSWRNRLVWISAKHWSQSSSWNGALPHILKQHAKQIEMKEEKRRKNLMFVYNNVRTRCMYTSTFCQIRMAFFLFLFLCQNAVQQNSCCLSEKLSLIYVTILWGTSLNIKKRKMNLFLRIWVLGYWEDVCLQHLDRMPALFSE